jgi:hypothetical protein
MFRFAVGSRGDDPGTKRAMHSRVVRVEKWTKVTIELGATDVAELFQRAGVAIPLDATFDVSITNRRGEVERVGHAATLIFEVEVLLHGADANRSSPSKIQ